MILGPAHDGLDWRSRAVLLSVGQLGSRPTQAQKDAATRARARWYDAGCPDLFAPCARVAGVLLASADFERRQRAWLGATDILTALGFDRWGRSEAAARLLRAGAAFRAQGRA